MTAPRLAIVGCGAIAERFHAPALRKIPGLVAGLKLVDPDPRRCRVLAEACGGGTPASDLTEVLNSIDAAVVTVPHHLHHRIARSLLEVGIPVLCEKPLAGTAEEARAIVALAESRNVPLAVNNTRRLYPSHRRVRELIHDGSIGTLQRIHFEDGDKFDWPLASGSLFGKAAGGRGILLDIGAHVVDLVCWWMGGRPEVIRHLDDSMGGTEATSQLELQHGSCVATVRLSWLSKLANGYVIEGSTGRIEGGIYDWSTLHVTRGGRRERLRLSRDGGGSGDFAKVLLDNFLAVLRGDAQPIVSGADVLPSLEVIDEGYAKRERLPMPWFDAFTRVAK